MLPATPMDRPPRSGPMFCHRRPSKNSSGTGCWAAKGLEENQTRRVAAADAKRDQGNHE